MTRAAMIVLGLGLVVTACGYPRPPAFDTDADTGDAGGTDADPNEVHGSVTDTFWEATTSVTMAHDLSGWTIAAMIAAPGATGGFTVYPGTVAADGTFAIPGVPVGATYLLKTIHDSGTHYTTTTARTFAFADDVLGRPKPAPTTQTTTLDFELTGLAAHDPKDLLEVVCVNNGGSVFSFDYLASSMGVPAVGATSLDNTSFDWSQPYGVDTPRNPLVDGDVGDSIDVIQEASVTQGSAYVATIARVFSTSFNQRDGVGSTLGGAFTTPSASFIFNPTFVRSAYEAHRPEVNPTTIAQQDGDYVLDDGLEPSPAGHGQYSATIDLAVGTLFNGSGDVAVGPIHFGDPFSSTWAHVFLTREQYGVSVAVDGGSPCIHTEAWFDVHNLAFTAGTELDYTIHPTISPPLAPKVGGQDAFAGGTFPTSAGVALSWSPPSVGTAALYAITVYRAQNPAGMTYVYTQATLSTTATSITIPAELFVAGGHYLFTVFAQDSAGLTDVQGAPTITGIWTAD